MASVIFLDGESKSGKTAVGRAIKSRLEAENYSVELIVAGHFFRRLTWLTLQMGLDLTSDDDLKKAVRQALNSPEMLSTEYDPATLEIPAVDHLVSRASQFDFVQSAANPWRERAAEAARAKGVDVVMMDGRNLRARLFKWRSGHDVPLALELVIHCNAEEAANRYLHDAGNKKPSTDELAGITKMVEARRTADRNRTEAPYLDPVNPVRLIAGVDNAAGALEESYGKPHGSLSSRLPRPILFDNSEVPRDTGLATVSELASLAVHRLNQWTTPFVSSFPTHQNNHAVIDEQDKQRR